MPELYRVIAYDFHDLNAKQSRYWRDVGTLDAYYEANMDLVESRRNSIFMTALADPRPPCSSRPPNLFSRRKAAAWESRSTPS